VRKLIIVVRIIAGGIALSTVVGGPSRSYISGYNSSLDGTSNCAPLNVPPRGADSFQYSGGCKAALQQWFGKFGVGGGGPFGGGDNLALVPGNPKFTISPLN